MKRLKMSKMRLQRELEEKGKIEDINMVASQQCVDPQLERESEEDNFEKQSWEELEKIRDIYLKDDSSLQNLTSLDRPTFEGLVSECSNNLSLTTFEGKERESVFSVTHIPSQIFISLTLIWLCHYLTIELLAGMIKIHSWTCSMILKQMTVALAKLCEMKSNSHQMRRWKGSNILLSRTMPSLNVCVLLTEQKFKYPDLETK